MSWIGSKIYDSCELEVKIIFIINYKEYVIYMLKMLFYIVKIGKNFKVYSSIKWS